MKIELQDHIDDYLLGRMSDQDRIAFEKQVEQDDELREQLDFTRNVRDSIKSRNEKLARIKEWEEKASKENAQNGVIVSMRRTLYWVSGIAAVFIAGVFVFNQFMPSSSERLPYVASQQDYSLGSNGAALIVGANPVQDIEQQLAAGDYQNALARIEKEEENVRTELMILERGLESRGEQQEDADEKHDSLDSELSRLLYLKAQALIGLGRNDEALVLLNSIRETDSMYKEQADSLYHLIQP
jgi:hypothetical protein